MNQISSGAPVDTGGVATDTTVTTVPRGTVVTVEERNAIGSPTLRNPLAAAGLGLSITGLGIAYFAIGQEIFDRAIKELGGTDAITSLLRTWRR